MKPLQYVAVLVCVFAAMFSTSSAHAQSAAPTVSGTPPKPTLKVLSGASREINHAHSASRDTGAMGWALTPYSVLTAGADVSILTLKLETVSLRLGFLGIIELESDRPYTGKSGDFIPRENSAFWRAHAGYSIAASFDRWARQALGERAALELCLSLRHESEHITGSTSGDAPKYGDRPLIGNFLMGDVSLRLPLGDFDLEVRFQQKAWVGGRAAYSVAPGGDVILRWLLRDWVRPFSSTFGEYMWGRKMRWDDGREVQIPGNYLVRNMTGLAFPGPIGELQLFSAVEIGNGKSLNVFREEVRWGGGIRLAFY